jgi:hypothetical protein
MQGSLSDTPVYSGPLRRSGVPSSKRPAAASVVRSERYQRFGPLILHALYLAFVVCVWQILDDPPTTLYIAGAVGIVIYGFLAFVELRRAPLFVSPLSTLFVWYLPPIGPSAIHYANKILDGDPIPFSVKMLQPDDVAAGYVIMILGNVALHLGLQWTRPFAASSAVPQSTGMSQPITLVILWAVSIGFRIAAKFVLSLGAIVGVIHFGSTAALAAFLLSYDAKKRGTLFWSVLVIGTIAEFITNLGSGSKAYLMFSFLPALWLFVRDQKLRKYIPILGIGMFALYVGVIAPVVMASRMLRGADAADSQTDRIVEVYSRGEYESEAGTDKQLPRYLERAFDAAASACIYGEVQKTGFMYGEGMDYLLYAFIPRIIWPDKPTVTRGAWFTVYLGQARSEEKATTSLGQTAAGELYWNFGWLGTFAGMAIIGAMCGRLWRLATPYAEKDALRLLLYFGVTFTMTHMAEAGSTFIALIYRAAALGLPIILLDNARRLAIQNRIINQ